MATFPEHRISNSKKQQEDWYINAYEYYLALATKSNNKEEVEDMLNAANGIIDEKTYAYVNNPLSGKGNKIENLPGVIREVDFLTPIKEKNLGEYLELPYKFHVLVNDPEIITARNLEIQKQITSLLEQEVINILNQSGVNTGMETKPLPDLEEVRKDIISSWLDERAQDGQDLLNLINQENDFDVERVQNFFYWWATEQFYTYHYIENGTVRRETISPLDGFPIDNGSQYVQDCDGFVIKRRISWERFQNDYRGKLSKADKEIVEEAVRNKAGSSGEYSVSHQFIESLTKREWTTRKGTINYKFADTNNIINEYVILFKTETQKNVLIYENQLGDRLERLVDDDYELNFEAGDIEVKKEYIGEVWQGSVIGSLDGARVYTKPEPIEVQRYDANFDCKLPIGGKKGMLNGNAINPIPKRILPNLALYRIYTLQQERAIARYKGSVMAVPKSALDNADVGASGAYFYLKADGTLIYDDSRITAQEMSVGFKIVSDDGLANFIQAMNDLRREMKEEAWELANMNSPRSGDINPSAGKGVTEQAIYRAKLGSVLMIYLFNKAMEKSHEIDLELSKVAFIDGKSGYYNNDDNEPIFVNIDGIKHFQTPYTLHVLNAKLEDDKLKAFKDMAFAASQNGDFDLAAEAITSNNTATIKRSIDKFMEAKREFEEYLEDKKNQALIKAQEMERENKNIEHEHKMEQIELEESLKTQRDLLLKSGDEGADSSLKSALDQIEARLKERKQELEERKQEHNETIAREKVDLDRQKIASAERIAKMNKN